MKRLFALPKMIFIALIHHPQISTALGVLCLLSLIWFGGPLVGFEATEGRLMVVVGILFFWVILLLISKTLEGRGGRSIELSLQQQAEAQMMTARPERKEEIKELQRELDKAIYALKHSKLGKGRRGSAALYALPWYMFIGPSASGKSTALQQSGLHFPYLGSSGRGIQGIGGTRNCDWWFTSEAVLLDTAGRYMTEDDDREEWFGFLNLLKKNRKRKPINGVIAAISIAELYQANEDELEKHAKNMRERIDELIERLGIRFPVYLVFTKCDLIQGFVEFFEDLTKGEREQVWGCTLPLKESTGLSPHLSFDTEFQKLNHALGARRMARLSSARGSRKVRNIYSFPLQFDAGREKLSRFVEILFKENPYRDNPIFRGFYFTSGTQEGTPIDRILSTVSRSAGVTDEEKEDFDTHKEAKSYFIKDLFTEVIFPDRFLAGASTAMVRQRGFLRLATFIVATLFVFLSVTGLVFSFLGNKNMIRSIRAVSLEAARMDVEDKDKLGQDIRLLDTLRVHLHQIQSYEKEGVPTHLQLGLYPGASLIPPLRNLYFDRFFSILLSPTMLDVERSLARFVSTAGVQNDMDLADHSYSLLKVYLMLSDPENLNRSFLKEWFRETIREGKLIGPNSEGLQEMVMEQVDFYIELFADKKAPLLQVDEALVKAVRLRLLDLSVEDRLYADIKKTGSADLKPYTLNRAMKGAPQNLLSSDFQIPGFFTKEGWARFPEVMHSVLTGSGEVIRVLGIQEMNQRKITTELKRRYYEEYAGWWQRYLESIDVVQGSTLLDVKDKINSLLQTSSPLRKVLLGVDENTFLFDEEASSGLSSQTGGFVDTVKKKFKIGSDNSGFSATLVSMPTNPVSIRFLSLHRFVTQGPDPDVPLMLERYSGEVAKVDTMLRGIIHSEETGIDAKTVAKGIFERGENELVQATRNTETLLRKFDPAIRTLVTPLFLEPFRMSAEGIMDAAIDELNQSWKSEVFQICQMNLAGRYPFYREGEDAAMDDVSELLQIENGVLWKYYEENIKPFVEKNRDGFFYKRGMLGVTMPLSSEFLEDLQQARLISESLFQRGSQSPTFSFGLYPYPSRNVSESVFQMDGNILRYRNEPQEWYEFTWPAKSGPPGAAIQIKSDGIRQARQFTGRWGLFKLLDLADLEKISSNRYKVTWRFRKPDSSLVEVKYDLRASSHKNPLKEKFFTKFRCSERVG